MSQVELAFCPTCKSKGFPISKLGPTRCTFCDGTEGGQGPTEEEIKDARSRPWIEHFVSEHGSFKRISGRFEFTTLANDFRYGDFLFILEDGTQVDCSRLFDFYDFFLILARNPERNPQELVDQMSRDRSIATKEFQKAYDEHMTQKYPGWRGLHGELKPERRKHQVEEVKSETINVEDLEL